VAATRCFRWFITGSEDGYIRKWDFFASMNGKSTLTQAQRHQLVDSITKAGYLASWWENEEQPEEVKVKAESSESIEVTPAPESKLSPVYSLDIHSDGLWALSGLENGSINLVTVRHEEGKCHHVFRKHTAPVSVLTIMPEERSFISGSWDKSIVVKYRVPFLLCVLL
jgi:transcriptional activator SPT8